MINGWGSGCLSAGLFAVGSWFIVFGLSIAGRVGQLRSMGRVIVYGKTEWPRVRGEPNAQGGQGFSTTAPHSPELSLPGNVASHRSGRI
jgi:hypothetical protein